LCTASREPPADKRNALHLFLCLLFITLIIMKNYIFLIATSILMVFSCQKSEAPEQVPVTSITLDQNAIEMKIRSVIQLTATITPSDATEKNITWESSNQSVAIVSKNGWVTSVAEGQSLITASAGGKSASCLVTVTKGIVDVSSVRLNKTTLALIKGESETLVATVNPDDATDKTMTWTSSNADVASVDANGKVMALANGTTTITAKAGGKEAACAVTVTVPLESISLNKTELSLIKGESETLIATIAPEDATENTVSWTSSNTSVATVESSGKVTAKGGGSATITAKAGGKEATCSVNVTVPVESVTLDKTNISIEEGESVTLSATVNPEDATDKTVTWSSSNESIASVDQNGKVTAIKEGNATIAAKAGEKEATCSVTVNKKVIPVTSITLDKGSLTLFVGNEVTLTATVLPDDATDKTVTWTSSNTSAATVENGVIKGVGAGRSTITATAGNISATCEVLVVYDSEAGVYAQYYGGAMSIINGKIQSGSQLNFGVVNYSSETIRVVSVQLIDGQSGQGGNVMSIGVDIASGSSSAWTITIGAAGIYEPTARFVFSFKGETYTCSAQYISL